MYAVILVALLLGAWWLFSRRSHASLLGKHVLITGCDSGFGELMALNYSQEGAHVYAGVLTAANGNSLKERSKGPGSMTPFVLDVTQSQQFQEAFSLVSSQLKDNKLDAIICNAGIFKGWLCEFTEEQEYQEVMDVNFMGTLRTIQKFLPLIRQPDGRVIGITSVAAFWCSRGMSAYGCSKFAQGALLDAIRTELYPCGIQVVQICPGFYNTPIITSHFGKRSVVDRLKEASDNVKGRYEDAIKETEASMGLAIKLAKDPIAVVKQVRRAILDVWPRSKMLVGWDAVVFWYLRFIPTFIAVPLFILWATKNPFRMKLTK